MQTLHILPRLADPIPQPAPRISGAVSRNKYKYFELNTDNVKLTTVLPFPMLKAVAKNITKTLLMHNITCSPNLHKSVASEETLTGCQILIYIIVSQYTGAQLYGLRFYSIARLKLSSIKHISLLYLIRNRGGSNRFSNVWALSTHAKVVVLVEHGDELYGHSEGDSVLQVTISSVSRLCLIPFLLFCPLLKNKFTGRRARASLPTSRR